MDTGKTTAGVDRATQAKNKGNEFYKKRNFKEAIECYTKAIGYDAEKASFYSNRSAAHYETGFYEGAVHDCLIAESLIDDNDALKSKVLLRRAKCLIFLGELEDAKVAIEMIPNVSDESQRVLNAITHRMSHNRVYDAINHHMDHIPTLENSERVLFHVNPQKAMRTLSRIRASFKGADGFELFPKYDAMSLIQELPEASSPDIIDHKYILERGAADDPIRVVLSGIGDGRMIFATLTDVDSIMEMHEYEDKRTKTALELVIFEEDPAMTARNMIIFDCILSFCKVLVENREMTMDRLQLSEGCAATLQEATYLSHLFFACKLPATFAESLRESLAKGIEKEQNVLAWAQITPADWLSVKSVMRAWANAEDEITLDTVDSDVKRAFSRYLHSDDWLKACAMRKRTATLNELREVAASKDYLETVYKDHKLHDKVPQDMDPQAYIRYLIEQVQDTPMDLVEPQNWPLRGTLKEHNLFFTTKKFTIPAKIEQSVLTAEDEEDNDFEYEVNPTFTNPLNNSFPNDRLLGYINPWEVAQQLVSCNVLMRDYAHSRATFNQPFVRQNAEVNVALATFSEDMYHFWRLLSLRFHRCLVSRRVRLKFVTGQANMCLRTSGNSIPHKMEFFDRMVFPNMLRDHSYFDVLTTSERIVRSKCLNGIYCILSPDKLKGYDDLRQVLRSQLSVHQDMLTPTLTHLFKVKLVKGLLDKPHVFIPIQRPRVNPRYAPFKAFYTTHMKAYYAALERKQRNSCNGDADDDKNRSMQMPFEDENDPSHTQSKDAKKGKKKKSKSKNKKKKTSFDGEEDDMKQQGKSNSNANDKKESNGYHDTSSSLSAFADTMNPFCMPDHAYFTEPNTTAYLVQLLMNCALPQHGNDRMNNLATWFHFVAKLCEEGIIPKHWVSLLIDQITTYPHIITTPASPEQACVTKLSVSKKVCLAPIMSEFLTLLRVWLYKVPCFDAFNFLHTRTVARVFFHFEGLFDLPNENNSSCPPLGLMVYRSDMHIWAAIPEKTDLRSLIMNMVTSPQSNGADTKKKAPSKRRMLGIDGEENFPDGLQLYSCLKRHGEVVSSLMLFSEIFRISQDPTNNYGALIRMDTWEVLNIHGCLIPPQAFYE